jgi:hypothetical protein
MHTRLRTITGQFQSKGMNIIITEPHKTYNQVLLPPFSDRIRSRKKLLGGGSDLPDVRNNSTSNLTLIKNVIGACFYVFHHCLFLLFILALRKDGRREGRRTSAATLKYVATNVKPAEKIGIQFHCIICKTHFVQFPLRI